MKNIEKLYGDDYFTSRNSNDFKRLRSFEHEWDLMKNYVENVLKKLIEISERITPGWTILAKRWVVERTFAWLGHFRRLSKDYEINIRSAETNVMIAHSILLLGRF